MAGRVEGGQEVLADRHLFDVVHKNVQIIESLARQFGIVFYYLLQLVDPSIQIGRGRTRDFQFQPLTSEVLVQFHVEQFQEVRLLVGQRAVDLQKVRVGFFEERVDQSGLTAPFLPVEDEGSVGSDEASEYFPLRQHKR